MTPTLTTIHCAHLTGAPLPPDAPELVGPGPGAWGRWPIGTARRFKLPIGSVWAAREVCECVEGEG